MYAEPAGSIVSHSGQGSEGFSTSHSTSYRNMTQCTLPTIHHSYIRTPSLALKDWCILTMTAIYKEHISTLYPSFTLSLISFPLFLSISFSLRLFLSIPLFLINGAIQILHVDHHHQLYTFCLKLGDGDGVYQRKSLAEMAISHAPEAEFKSFIIVIDHHCCTA